MLSLPDLVAAPLLGILIVVLLVGVSKQWAEAYALLGRADPVSRALTLPLKAVRVRGGWIGAGIGLCLAVVIVLVVPVVTSVVFVGTQPAARWDNDGAPLTTVLLFAVFGLVMHPIVAVVAVAGLALLGMSIGSHITGRRFLTHYADLRDRGAIAASSQVASGTARALVIALVIVGVVAAVGLGAASAATAWIIAGWLFLPATAGSKTM